MKLYAPKYYKDFKCIADKCVHSCCIGWEIDIDSQAFEKYKNLFQGYGKNIINSIDMAETPHFRLCQGEKCPHLNQKGLCEIILNFGEDYLCHICREHPRFYNHLPRHMEVGIGMACEEAARIILSSDNYGELAEIDNAEGEEYPCDFDVLFHRSRIYGVLQDESAEYNAKLQFIYDDYGVSPRAYGDEAWHRLIEDLEYLDEDHKRLFLSYSSDIKVDKRWEKQLERALAYFIFRHCSNAFDEHEFCSALGFCLFCERLLASLMAAKRVESASDIITLARIISEELEYSEDNTYAIMREF